MESILTILLCLPHGLGGYGIKLPLLNHRIDLGKSARRITDKSFCECDLYWSEEKLAVEYDGEVFHTGIENISKDSTRRDALIAMGVTVVTVTKWQINNSKELNGIAQLVGKRLGKRFRYKDPEFTRRCLKLRKSLLERQ
jgi:hypothetical protein